MFLCLPVGRNLVPNQSAPKEPYLAPFCFPDHVLSIACVVVPIVQEVAKTIMKPPMFSGIAMIA
jgi:hypothetical protein